MIITTKDEYLNALAKALGTINEMDRMDALQYYREYFEEAGMENESRVIAELGSPKKLASQIRAQSAVKAANEDPKSGSKSLRAVWLAVLSVFAVPVGIPIALALVIVVFALLITLFAVLLSLFAVAFSFGLCAVISVLASMFALFQNIGASMTMLGCALILGGLGVLFFIPTLTFSRWSVRKLTGLAGRITRRQIKS